MNAPEQAPATAIDLGAEAAIGVAGAAHGEFALADAQPVVAGAAAGVYLDALAAGRVALQILRKYSDQVPQSAAELHDQQVTFSDQNDASYERFRQGTDPNFTVQRGWPIKK